MPPLPRLRQNLDFMPSPIPDQPGLLIRDSFHYSEAVLVVPPPLVPALVCFDGQQTEADLRALLVRISGSLDVSAPLRNLRDILHRSGFLEDEQYAAMREARERAFDQSPVREPAHAGTAYPQDLDALRPVMQQYLGTPNVSGKMPVAIAAPHVSPEGGWECYRAAYCTLPPEAKDKTFVVLGTSHYGEPERFGLTRKPFRTPWGTTQTAPDLLLELEAQPSAKQEDYCHAVEHSIEFQVLFLQSIFGPGIRVLPILVGSFRQPERNENVGRFLDALAEIHAREANRLLWVVGVDMAHMGRRYGDEFEAIAEEGKMAEVAGRDHSRMERLAAGDAPGFWEQIEGQRDPLKWCGSAPLYTYLRAVPQARGTLQKYEQWNIDEASVVSFAGMTFI